MGLHGDTLVHRVDADPIPARKLVRGMAVRTLSGSTALVACVVRTDVSMVPDGYRLVNCGSRCWVSEHLPVRRLRVERATRWMYAKDTGDVVPSPTCHHIYDVVLSNENTLCVGDDALFGVATLGARVAEASLPHWELYLGTARIIEDLQRHPSYKRDGLVDLRTDMFTRHNGFNVITGLRANGGNPSTCCIT
ncbi:hypothetical protein CYMTET_40938 [Cymbomonas tetramitiformis]|uniref:Vint domain-containing protein n=1 Tax=Cymbomonas tetramitiformis TaxID=36881 RepID=A0AAE0C746_9CHLO|nr:hypothetical protein CYMTET_40938 [Cymbomonas tetramitiformis]|eukprot:gene236-414_t